MNEERQFHILLIEGDVAHAQLFQECFIGDDAELKIEWLKDGEAAFQYLEKERSYGLVDFPDLIVLSLNLEKRDGRDVLDEIKSDSLLQSTPVVVLTPSGSAADVAQAYQLGANCYITKPVTYREFIEVIGQIRKFWLDITRLPQKGGKVFRPVAESPKTDEKAPQ